VVLDDCNFHECVNLDDFESTRTLALIPPDGEFVVMNYRITSDFRAPFRLFPLIEETSPYKIELLFKVRADIPAANYGSNVVIRFPVPKNATTVIPELGPGATAGLPKGVTATAIAAATGSPTGVGQTAEYNAKEREVVWTIKKFMGGSEHTLRTKITLSAPSTTNIRKELGPVSLGFEIPMYNVSNLAVKYLRIAEADKRYKPYRWVRYVATSNSYVCRL
jgi:AP-4 complex subunit mu-1